MSKLTWGEELAYNAYMANWKAKRSKRREERYDIWHSPKFKIGDIVCLARHNSLNPGPHYVSQVIKTTGNENQIVVTKFLEDPHFIDTNTFDTWRKLTWWELRKYKKEHEDDRTV